MKNLSGNKHCDDDIRYELRRCRIDIVEGERSSGEVPASITGKLGPFTFERGWYYWMVTGPMPLAVARELYADPVGRDDIRASGSCACPDPATQATYYDAAGCVLVSDPDGSQEANTKAFIARYPQYADALAERFVPNAADVAVRAVVESYHIDTELGLRIFADAIRAHGLDGGGNGAESRSAVQNMSPEQARAFLAALDRLGDDIVMADSLDGGGNG